MDILGIVAALAPDHVQHVPHTQLESATTDVAVQCGCSVRFTFLATEIAKLEPAEKATIAFQVGTRSAVVSTATDITNEGTQAPSRQKGGA
jgi:predicted Na+-dependent transporter